jgi:hypothetical protein
VASLHSSEDEDWALSKRKEIVSAIFFTFIKTKTMESSTLIKEKLHHYIDVANDEKLQAIYVLLENEIDWHYTSADMEELMQRKKRHLNGESKSYTVEESLSLVRKQAK